MPNQRTEAEAIATCLEFGLVNVGVAVEWADCQIAATAVPVPLLCEVSMATPLMKSEVVLWLRSLPGEVDQSYVLRELLLRAVETLRTHPDQSRMIAFTLFQLAMDGTLPPGDLERDAFWFYDAIDLAQSGQVHERPDEVIAQMIERIHAALGQ